MLNPAKGILILPLMILLGCSTTNQVKSGSNGHILFTEEDSNWSLKGDASWIIDKGIITGQGGQGYAFTTETFDNFILEAEFYPDEVINSGIFVRCPQKEASAVDCYEINIWDNHTNQDFRTGSIVRHGKPLAHINSVAKWNKYKIKAMDNHIEVWLNGTKTADLIDEKTASGYIGLQVFDQGTIKFRNIHIQKL